MMNKIQIKSELEYALAKDRVQELMDVDPGTPNYEVLQAIMLALDEYEDEDWE
jgi:antitoxin component HigA of HigAB toxin-antitoxin module